MKQIKNSTDFSKWELDRDIPDKIWNHYLKKYIKNYILFKGEEGTWKIKCKFGQIEPYSLKKSLLLFAGSFPTPSKKTYFLKSLRGIKLPKGKEVEIVQEGYDECNIKLEEKNLKDLIRIFKVRQRRHLSKEEIQRRRERMAQARTKKVRKNGN